MEPKFSKEEWDWVDRMERLKSDFRGLDKITDKWGFFRQVYMESLTMIMDRAKADKITPINPYPIDWGTFLSPIEFDAWQSIRSHYMALYPQFPVFNYFIDFANPYLRIGVEMDGKDYHDPEKDRLRDEMLWKYGWRIFRTSGRECRVKFRSLDLILEDFREYHQDEAKRDAEIEHWLHNTSDGVIYAIKRVYFMDQDQDKHDPIYRECIWTLDKHKGADFNLFD